MEQRCVCRCAGTMTWLGLILALLRRRQPVMAPCKRYTLFCVALPWYGTLIARQTEPRIGSGPANSMAGSRSWAEVQTSKDDRSNPRLGWRRARHGTARPWPDGGQEHAPQGPRTRPRMGTACGRERPGPWPAWTAQPYSPCKGGGGGSTGMRHDGGGSRCMDRPDDRPLTGALSSAVCYTPVSDRHGGPLRMRAACTTDVTSHVCDSSAVLKYHFAQYGEEDGSTHGSLLPPSTSNT